MLQNTDLPANWELDIQRINAHKGVDGEGYVDWEYNDDEEVLYNIDKNITDKFWKRPVLSGEIGCWMSHMEAIRNTPETSKYLLVLEDDATFNNNFFYQLQRCILELENIEFDYIDFGRLILNNKCGDKVTPFISKLLYSYQAHCILYSQSGIAKFKKLKENINIITPDEFLPATRHAHPRVKINKLYFDEPLIGLTTNEQLSWQSSTTHDTEIILQPLNMKPLNIKYNFNKYEIKENLDNSDSVDNYYYYNNVFNNTEIQEIILMKSFEPCETNKWLFQKLEHYILDSNKSIWNFQLTGIDTIEMVTELPTNWHVNIQNKRKLIAISHLYNSPDLDGGINQIQTSKDIRNLTESVGSLTIYPSFILSRTTPIIKGSSKYLIIHVFGDSFC